MKVLRNWPKPSIYEPLPWPVEVDGGLMFAELSQAQACKRRVEANGITCRLWVYPGAKGVFAEISHAA